MPVEENMPETPLPEEVFPRADLESKEHNPRGYTTLELKKRDLALIAMMKDYPDLVGGQQWCEMIYDFVTHQDKTEEGREELRQIIEEKKWKNRKTTRNYKGGTIKCMENLTPEEYNEKYGETEYDKVNKELGLEKNTDLDKEIAGYDRVVNNTSKHKAMTFN